MKNVTQTVSMGCAVLMDPVRMDAAMQSLGLDVEENVGKIVSIASVHITVLNVHWGFTDCIVKKHAKTIVTTVPNPPGIVTAVKLVFMASIVHIFALTDVKRVNL